MIDFLQDEVRSGFYIPTVIKQAWAVQLKILSEIDRICSKYDIKYFADWGTYLGTVRHGGFIPWDDDLDICMIREDYERFKKAAKSELPKGYTIHNFETKENHRLFLARVVNSNSICFDKEHLDENYNFPYIATVDIFILDYLYRDEEKERERCDEVKKIIALADGIENSSYSAAVTVKLLGEFEKKYGLEEGSLWNNSGCKEDFGEKSRHKLWVALYRLAETQMGRTPKEEADNIGQIFPWVLKGGRGLQKEYYEKTVRLPFEYTTMPVPAFYHQGLRGRYGDYMKVYKIWGGHDYPYFEGQKANLQAVADFKLPEFSFKADMLRENQPPVDKSGSLKAMAAECMTELERMTQDVARTGEQHVAQPDTQHVLETLAACQQLAVDLGTLVEEVKGENRDGTIAVVGSLEVYCEAVYGLYMYVQESMTADGNRDDIVQNEYSSYAIEEKINALETALQAVREKLETYVINRKEVLFVAVGEKSRSRYSKLYEVFTADADTDVYVVNVLVMRKDVYGQIMDAAADGTVETVHGVETALDDSVKTVHGVVDWRTYPLELHVPDMIFIQDEYDAENPCLTLPEKFYAQNLQRYTDKLVFVTSSDVNEFKREDTTDWYNTKHYITAPGVVRADVILVQSENMKQNYVDRLTEFAGEDTHEIWNRKVMTWADFGISIPDGRAEKQRRRMMYCIGLNELPEHRGVITGAVRNRLDIMKKNGDRVDAVVCLYPPDEALWREAEPELSDEIFEVIGENYSTIKPEILDSCDAYYGSPSPYAHYFNSKGKPVMLCDYTICSDVNSDMK